MLEPVADPRHLRNGIRKGGWQGQHRSQLCLHATVACRVGVALVVDRRDPGQLQPPADGALVQRQATFVVPAAVEVCGGLRRRHRLERPGGARRGLQLDDALVGEAVHPHVAVGSWQLARPVDRGERVCRLVATGIEGAPRAPAATDVLDHDAEALRRVPGGVPVDGRGRHRGPVGQSHQQCRVLARRVWRVDVGAELDAVGQRQPQVLFD